MSYYYLKLKSSGCPIEKAAKVINTCWEEFMDIDGVLAKWISDLDSGIHFEKSIGKIKLSFWGLGSKSECFYMKRTLTYLC